MKRDSMIFYASFHEAAKALESDTDKAALYDAIFEYALFGKEFELTGTPRAMFMLIKPQLDANIRKYKNGKRPKKKQTGSKTEAPKKQNGSKTEGNVNVNVNDNYNENDNVNFTIDECLTYLNKKAGAQFKLKTESHRKYIGGRISDGATIEQLKAVIDLKVREWSNDPQMSKYLRPSTLFQPEKFDGYLAETNRTGPPTAHRYDHTRIKEHETYMDRVKRNRIDPRDTEAVKVFVDEEDKHPTTVQIIQDRYKSNPEEFPYVEN